MSKDKDVILIEMYDKAEVRMVTEWLERKMRRVADRDRKTKDNAAHLRKIAEKRGAV